MTTNNPSFFQNCLKSDPSLFEKILGFNVSIPLYLHHSYLDKSVTDEVIKTILLSPRSAHRYSKNLLAKFNLANDYCFDFSNSSLKLALLDATILNELALYAGATIHSNQLKTIIRKQEVLSLKTFLSEKIYSFALKRTLIYKKYIPPSESLFPIPIDLRDRITQAGFSCFEICLSGLDHAVLERFKLKFPNTQNWNFSRSTSDEIKLTTFSLLSKLLAKEMKQAF